MKRSVILLAVVLLGLSAFSLGKTEVYQLVDSPFVLDQCYALGDWNEGPATFFGEDVCVHYEALNDVTTRVKTNKDGTFDVGWTLLQKGIATITSMTTGEVLYVGPFKVEEIGQDDGGDAFCLGGTVEEPVAWLGKCGANLFSTLDFARYHWKIQGAKVYYFEVRVNDPGQFCYLSNGEVIYDGGGCPAGKAK